MSMLKVRPGRTDITAHVIPKDKRRPTDDDPILLSFSAGGLLGYLSVTAALTSDEARQLANLLLQFADQLDAEIPPRPRAVCDTCPLPHGHDGACV
jgi:hypothetical protein